jgi:phage major head subunit gpT-like protein
MGSPIISENFIRLLDTRLKEVSENAWSELPSQKGELYRDVPSDSAWEEFFSVGAVADIPAFNGKLSFLTQSPGYLSRIEPKEYAAGLAFERKFLDDKKYAVMSDQVENLTIAAQRTKAKMEVDPFANAFSSAFTFLTSEEGVSLCSDTHTTKSGVSTATGFDNAGTSAMSKTSVAATRLAMLRLKNDIGERIVVEPDTIVCGESLADTAMEIVGTPSGYETAASTKNMDYKRYKVLVLKRLDDYDSNNWFMVDSRQMKKHLLWIDRIAKETKMTVDFDTFMTKFSIYFRCGNGFKDWRWIYGHNVS